MTCDFAVSTGTFQRAAQNSQILKLLIDTAADGLSQQFLKGHEEVQGGLGLVGGLFFDETSFCLKLVLVSKI